MGRRRKRQSIGRYDSAPCSATASSDGEVDDTPQRLDAHSHEEGDAATTKTRPADRDFTAPPARRRGRDDVDHRPVVDVRSSWFPGGATWIFRPRRHRASIRDDDRAEHDAAGRPIATTAQRPTSAPYDELLQSLERTKRELMPSAEACAYVINNRRGNHRGAVDEVDAMTTMTTTTTTMRRRRTMIATTTPMREFQLARSACNPYESLGMTGAGGRERDGMGGGGGGHRRITRTAIGHDIGQPRGGDGGGLSQFVNRSAIKLANIDAMLGFILTFGIRELEEEDANEEEEEEEHAEEEDGCNQSTIQNDVVRRHPPHRDPFVFVDLCGAPGGFSEYLLYRRMHPPSPVWRADEDIDNDDDDDDDDDDVPPPKRQRRGGVVRGDDIPTSSSSKMECANDDVACYGFGMSLGGRNADGRGIRWDLDHLGRYVHLRRPTGCDMDDDADVANDPISTSHYRICRGADGTGSVYVWDNVLRLRREIRSTVVVPLRREGNRSDDVDDGRPLADLVVADGGFDAQRDAVDQESMAHKLVISQTAAALTLLRSGGIFVLKMFGFRREGTRRMLTELYLMFDRMTFLKPISSRPASAERYLVCCGYAGPGPGWDGLAWRERMMLEESPESRGAAREEYSPLESSMDSFDGEMAKLNLNTCRSIVKYLDDKRASVERGDISWNSQGYSLDPRQFEEAWQLRYSR